jgi:azurin
MVPLAKRTAEIGCKLGLYNHGGWGGEPENLLAVCLALRTEGHDHVGIVYNWHHGHGRIEEWKQDLDLMLPYLHCLNLNGMNAGAQPKILELGKGEHEKKMLKIVLESGYNGPVGILDHQNELDAEKSLQANLAGLDSLLEKINSSETMNETLPFPHNRLRHFYRTQAQSFIAQEDRNYSRTLKPFSGLDGGGWGHWGQNPESDNVDDRLNEIDFGGILMQATNHAEGWANKGVSVQAGKYSAVFDPEKLCFVDAWEGGLPEWSARRYGLTSGVKAKGKKVEDFASGEWKISEGVKTKYLGFYRIEERTVFSYRIGKAEIYEWIDGNGALSNERLIKGKIPSGVTFQGNEFVRKSSINLNELLKPSQAQWSKKTVVTKGKVGKAHPHSPYVIDTLTIPYRDLNPFKTPMRIGGVGALSDGRIAVCTLMGDVWIVDGVDDTLERLVWKRFASGLNQPLGLVVSNDQIHVIGRDQLTRLHDLNQDGEADFYECLTNEFPTARGNSFALTLHQDDQSRFYWFTRSSKFGMTRFTIGSKPEAIATGLRGCNGTGVSPDGSIVFAMPQEGSWQPASGIFEVGKGSYHGFFGPKPEFGKHGYQMPLCFLPRGIDNSSGDILFVPKDERFGPLAGRMIGTSFGYCEHYLVLREVMENGQVQGGVVPLPGEFLSGAHRGSFSSKDGHLYIVGTDGWQSYAQENGSLQRVRWTGGEMLLPDSVETRKNGLIIRFNEFIDPQSLDVDKVFASQWNYLHSEAYGSPEYSVRQPGITGHDPVKIRSLHTLEDGKSIFLEIPQLHPVMQFHLYLELKTRDGRSFTSDLYYSIFHQGKEFTSFPGYEKIAKETWKDFPHPDKSPVDPRLLAQEAQSKIVGDEQVLAAIERIELDAIAGLQYAQKELRVKPGSKVALTFRNLDPSMPHNVALVQPDRLTEIMDASMKLASSPKGVAQHYVPNDKGIIAMSPILQSGNSYVIYFRAPRKLGTYPFLCTFPGHWHVMQGKLIIE